MDNCPHCGGALALRFGQTIYFHGHSPRLVVSDGADSVLIIDTVDWAVAGRYDSLAQLLRYVSQRYTGGQMYSLEKDKPITASDIYASCKVYGKSPTEAVAGGMVPLSWQAPKR